VEFVVDDITDIVWNPSSFDNLAIPTTKKKVITALAKAHISRAPDDVIDDFVEGKGQGLIRLLQYAQLNAASFLASAIYFRRYTFCR
jgi:hypothetical protein